MPLPASKSELLDNLNQATQKLDNEFNTIDLEIERTKEIEGNISCCDLLAYQIGWGKLLLGWEEQEKSGKKPCMPATGFKWNQLGELAESFYNEYSEENLTQLRKDFKKLNHSLVVWIESLTDQELFESKQRIWAGEKWAVVKWIQVNTIAPYCSARTKLRRWKQERAPHTK